MLSRAAKSELEAMRSVGEDAIRIAVRSLRLQYCQIAGLKAKSTLDQAQLGGPLPEAYRALRGRSAGQEDAMILAARRFSITRRKPRTL